MFKKKIQIIIIIIIAKKYIPQQFKNQKKALKN